MARGILPLCLLTDCNTLQHTATHRSTYILWQGVLQTHCNTLQPLPGCCPPKKLFDAIKHKNQSTMGGKRIEAMGKKRIEAPKKFAKRRFSA